MEPTAGIRIRARGAQSDLRSRAGLWGSAIQAAWHQVHGCYEFDRKRSYSCGRHSGRVPGNLSEPGLANTTTLDNDQTLFVIVQHKYTQGNKQPVFTATSAGTRASKTRSTSAPPTSRGSCLCGDVVDGFEDSFCFDGEEDEVFFGDWSCVHGAQSYGVESLEGYGRVLGVLEPGGEQVSPVILADNDGDVVGEVRVREEWLEGTADHREVAFRYPTLTRTTNHSVCRGQILLTMRCP